MSKLKKVLLMCTAYVLVAALAIGGTIAYLRDSDSDVNVMTLGNVKIEQHEYQRADGVAHDEGEPGAGKGVKEGALVPFVQGQALYPAVPKNNAGGDYTAEMDTAKLFFWGDYVYSGTAGNGLWDDSKLSNVMDKMVFVENTGKSDAYIRTVIAFECPEGITIGEPSQGAEIMINTNIGTYDWDDVGYITVDGVRYAVMTATYKEVLAPGNQSHPSLLQVVMTHHATNEDVALLGDTYEILVVSQAVQAAGFDSAAVALDTAFGKPSEKAAEWFGGITVPTGAGYNGSFVPAPEGAVLVNGTDKAAVLAAIEAAQPGDVVALTEDTTIAGSAAYQKLIINKNITLNLNGKTLTTECGWGGIDLKNGASIVNGTINHTGNTAAIKAFQAGKIENVIINVTETAGKIKGGIVVQEGAGCYVGSIKNVTINGATNGIETYRCGYRTDLAIGSMENVTINAIDTGISLSAPIGEVKNCTIKGAKIGVNAYLYGPYSVTADFINCVIEGADADIYAHDEVGKTNPGSITVTYDSVMSLGLNVISEIEAEAAGRVFIGIK